MNKIYLSLALISVLVLAGCSLLTNTNQNINSTENQNVNINENKNINASKNLNTNQPTDDRILLTPDNLEQYCNPLTDMEPCYTEIFNTDPATTTVTYTNQEKEISVDLPYNPDWGSDNYRINPYDEEDDRVNFGPINLGEGGGWGRWWWALSFQPAETADQVIAGLDKDSFLFLAEPEKDKVNNLEIVKYAEIGLTSYHYIIVIGEKYNYEFISTGHLDTGSTEDELADLESIVKTVSLY